LYGVAETFAESLKHLRKAGKTH